MKFHVTNDEMWNAEGKENNISSLKGAKNIRVVAPGTNRNRRMADVILSLEKVAINTSDPKELARIRFD